MYFLFNKLLNISRSVFVYKLFFEKTVSYKAAFFPTYYL